MYFISTGQQPFEPDQPIENFEDNVIWLKFQGY
jgi:hypothetical protein